SSPPEQSGGNLCFGLNADDASGLADLLEGHGPLNFCKERIISADADVFARAELRAALSDEDAPCQHPFAAVPFHAQTLGIAIATIAGTADAFFVCHD